MDSWWAESGSIRANQNASRASAQPQQIERKLLFFHLEQKTSTNSQRERLISIMLISVMLLDDVSPHASFPQPDI